MRLYIKCKYKYSKRVLCITRPDSCRRGVRNKLMNNKAYPGSVLIKNILIRQAYFILDLLNHSVT